MEPVVLVGLEACTDGHRQDGQRAEGVQDLAKHLVPSFPVGFGSVALLRPYLGLYRAPAASASVASVAAVSSKCFHAENFARIGSPPWNCLEQCRRRSGVPTSGDGREPRWADTGTRVRPTGRRRESVRPGRRDG